MQPSTSVPDPEPLITAEFALDERIMYLNHAAVSPWPRRTSEAVSRFAQENTELGSQRYPHWLEVEQRLRARLCGLINAPAVADIALLKNTSEGLSVVAQGLDWSRGDNVVTSNQEFPSNRIVWASLAPRGVALVQVDLGNASSPEDALMQGCDRHTRLLAISSVEYATGLRLDLERLGRFCKARGILFCVDAIQSVGAAVMDVQAAHIDFLAADGHKWMLGPEGLALFYCRAALRERLSLHQHGWHMIEHPHDFECRDWQPATSARRFECGSPNMLCIHALDASISLLEEFGLARVESRLLALSERIVAGVKARPALELITDDRPGRLLGIVTFRHREIPATVLYPQLMEKNVMCAQRGGGIRFSPHFYTHPDTIMDAFHCVDEVSSALCKH